jgi:glycogen debranching enzyme
MARDTVSILDGSTFLVSDSRGDIDASPDAPHGLFYRDTRFLSRWVLTLNERPLNVLSTDSESDYFAAQFFLVPPTGTVYRDSALSVIRRRLVGEGVHEDVTVINHGEEVAEVVVRIEADADFADLFEVKDALDKKGELERRVEDGRLVLTYRREEFVRRTSIRADAPETQLDERGLSFPLALEPGASWSTCIWVEPDEAVCKYRHGDDAAKPNMRQTLDEWIESAPVLDTDWDLLQHVYEKSLVDLAALRFYAQILPGAALPAAGLPWFMALFGRDSLITSLQALPFTPELAETTLRVLAARQGTKVDDFRDEEPGKILHELRFGELTVFEERPHSPYFGTADATPLFLALLEETERWTGNAELVRELEPAARAALAWIDEWGDRDGDGYVEYQRRNTETGLENQCWKDSWDSIKFRDGRIAKGPIATCEIQGYVYDAKLRVARRARDYWGDGELAARLEREAAELKRRFDADFWLPERGYYALALDGEKRPVDSITSNAGHLLWSGIVPAEKAEAVVSHLLGEALFSGWGIRTMAAGEGGYNPIRYHNGTVWPHDNSLIALGLVRYGYRAEAARLARAIVEAAGYFRHRLPEVFAGYPREETKYPVEYPTASSPQAWATGTPLVFLRTLLGLEPDGDELTTNPFLPDGIGRLKLWGIPGRWGRADVAGEHKEAVR